MNHPKKPILTLVALAALCLLLSGCSPKKVNTAAGLKLTFDRGAQLLASGNPKSAIPFLTQTVTSAPDGPEPVALLSLAYALDLQSDRAIREAALVRRPEGAAPGWEFVAVGIAQMTANQPRTAAETLKQGLAKLEDHAPIAPAARQWLALSQILAGDDGAALETLQALAESPAMQTTTTSWEVMLHARRGRSTPASKALARCAALSANRSGELALRENLTGADAQTLCDAAIAALSAGRLEQARALLMKVQGQPAHRGEVAVWLALITVAQGDWQSGRTMLKHACDVGSPQSRGLANQLFSVICATEDRPEDVIDRVLVGQRLLGRASAPVHAIDQPQPEPVWYSDSIR